MDKFHFYISNLLFHISRVKKHSAVSYPRHWPGDIGERSVFKIQVSDKVFEKLKQDFQATIQKSVWIDNIKEICNPDFFDRYEKFECFLLREI